MTNENIEREMKVKIVEPPPKPIADDMSVPPNLLAEAAKFRMGNDVEFVLVNTKRGSIAFCFACGSKILCSSNKLDNFQNGHLGSSKHKNASQGSGLHKLLKTISDGNPDEVAQYIARFRSGEGQGVKRPRQTLSELERLLAAHDCLVDVVSETRFTARRVKWTLVGITRGTCVSTLIAKITKPKLQAIKPACGYS